MDALSDVNPILQPFRTFGNELSPVDQIAQQASVDLGLNSDEVDLFDFLIGSPKVASIMQEAEEYNITEEDFKEKVLAKLNESLPEPTEEMRDNKFMLNNGYMTMIPYALEHFRRELHTYMKSRIFQLAEEKSEEGVSLPSTAMQVFGQALINRIQEYAVMIHPTPVIFNQWVKKEGKEYSLKKENAEEANKSVATINEQTSEAHKLYEEYVEVPKSQQDKGGMLYETVTKPMKQYDELRLNLSYYVHQEFKWQLLNAQIASEDLYDEVLARIAFSETLFRRLIDEKMTDVTLEHIIAYFVNMYNGFFSEEISNERAEFASHIIVQMIDEFNSSGMMKEALTLAQKAILKRVQLGSTNSKFIRKYLLETPLYDENRPVLSILRLFDALIEFEPSQLDTIKDRLETVIEYAYLVLGFNDIYMLNNMVKARALFTQTLLSVDDNKQVFVRLYELVGMAVEGSAGKDIINFASTIDKNINHFQEQMNQTENIGMSMTYFAMKVQVANLAKDEAWETSFVKPFEAQMSEEIEYLQTDSAKWVLQSINRGLKNLGVQVYKSTSVSDRVNSLIEAGSFSSDKLKVIKRLLI